MSENTIGKVNEFIAGAFKLIQLGIPVARETFIIIEIAASLAQRLADGDKITDGEIDAAILTRKSALRDILNKE